VISQLLILISPLMQVSRPPSFRRLSFYSPGLETLCQRHDGNSS
jgi:hypothetical protein